MLSRRGVKPRSPAGVVYFPQGNRQGLRPRRVGMLTGWKLGGPSGVLCGRSRGGSAPSLAPRASCPSGERGGSGGLPRSWHHKMLTGAPVVRMVAMSRPVGAGRLVGGLSHTEGKRVMVGRFVAHMGEVVIARGSSPEQALRRAGEALSYVAPDLFGPSMPDGSLVQAVEPLGVRAPVSDDEWKALRRRAFDDARAQDAWFRYGGDVLRPDGAVERVEFGRVVYGPWGDEAPQGARVLH